MPNATLDIANLAAERQPEGRLLTHAAPRRTGVRRRLVPARPTHLAGRCDEAYIALMDVNPRLVHVHWELDEASLAPELRGLLHQAELALRFYDVTYILFDGGNAHSSFDIPVGRRGSSSYVQLPSAGRSLIVDLGIRTRGGRFYTLARSNCVQMPRAMPACDGALQWMRVPGDRHKRRLLPEEFVFMADEAREPTYHGAQPAQLDAAPGAVCREDIVRAYSALSHGAADFAGR